MQMRRYVLLNLTLAIVLDGSASVLVSDVTAQQEHLAHNMLSVFESQYRRLAFNHWRDLCAPSLELQAIAAATAAAHRRASDNGEAQGIAEARLIKLLGDAAIFSSVWKEIETDSTTGRPERAPQGGGGKNEETKHEAPPRAGRHTGSGDGGATASQSSRAKVQEISLRHAAADDEEQEMRNIAAEEVAKLGTNLRFDEYDAQAAEKERLYATSVPRTGVRLRVVRLLAHPCFLAVLQVAIVASAVAMLDPDATRPTTARAGRVAACAWLYLDYACTALFVVEALAKGVGHGVAFPPWPCASGKYKDGVAVRSEQFLSSATEINDMFVIVASLAGYAVARSAGGGGYDVGRTLRLLGIARGGRPLRLLFHMPSILKMHDRRVLFLLFYFSRAGPACGVALLAGGRYESVCACRRSAASTRHSPR